VVSGSWRPISFEESKKSDVRTRYLKGKARLQSLSSYSKKTARVLLSIKVYGQCLKFTKLGPYRGTSEQFLQSALESKRTRNSQYMPGISFIISFHRPAHPGTPYLIRNFAWPKYVLRRKRLPLWTEALFCRGPALCTPGQCLSAPARSWGRKKPHRSEFC
jgi:hypothetical protein